MTRSPARFEQGLSLHQQRSIERSLAQQSSNAKAQACDVAVAADVFGYIGALEVV